MSDVRPGRLKVYLGAAPGVGKTYRMLDEGRRRAARGTDVVVGFAECHGRPRTEAMLDGSDAIADWPLLNALLNTASGATWVSIHHGGGVGMGRSLHAGQVTVADGTALAGEKIRRVLTNDPGMGVIRHVDAGYEEAEAVADAKGVRIPMQEQAREEGK